MFYFVLFLFNDISLSLKIKRALSLKQQENIHLNQSHLVCGKTATNVLYCDICNGRQRLRHTVFVFVQCLRGGGVFFPFSVLFCVPDISTPFCFTLYVRNQTHVYLNVGFAILRALHQTFAHTAPNICAHCIKHLSTLHQTFQHTVSNICAHCIKHLRTLHQTFAHTASNISAHCTKHLRKLHQTFLLYFKLCFEYIKLKLTDDVRKGRCMHRERIRWTRVYCCGQTEQRMQLTDRFINRQQDLQTNMTF